MAARAADKWSQMRRRLSSLSEEEGAFTGHGSPRLSLRGPQMPGMH